MPYIGIKTQRVQSVIKIPHCCLFDELFVNEKSRVSERHVANIFNIANLALHQDRLILNVFGIYQNKHKQSPPLVKFYASSASCHNLDRMHLHSLIMVVMFFHWDIVEWRKDVVMCVVISLVPILGFNLYTIMEVDSGVTHVNVEAHELKTLSDDLGEINLPSEILTEPY